MCKKKICLISMGNLYLCPYITKYISLLDCEYDIIYWDRHGIEEDINANRIFGFRFNMDEGKGKFKKAIGYLKFQMYALNIIKKNNYDGVILLQTTIGILLQSILKKKYKGKYILDIRDYTMEKNPIFYSFVKSLIKLSAYTVISSDGFKNFLPKYDYTIVHNDVNIEEGTVRKFTERKLNKDKIVISYIGLIRFHEQNKRIILKFKNDKRFLLKFIGKDSSALQKFCQNNNVINVELIDRFPPKHTLDFYYETDIIYNLYGNNTPVLDYALSNKLYYAAKLKIPILVYPKTYMEKISVEYGFGYVFNPDEPEACSDLFEYYNTLNWNVFNRNCEEYVKVVERENLLFNDTILEFIEKI